MTLSMAQQLTQSAIAFEEQRLGRKPTSVTVVIGGDTLVIMLHGVCLPPNKFPRTRCGGQLEGLPFWKRAKMKRKATATVQVFSVGTVVQMFLLAGRLPADSWDVT